MTAGTPDHTRLLADALGTIRGLKQRVTALEAATREPIAIIGMGCRFPGGLRTVDDYWRALAGGVDAIEDIPPDRWDKNAYYDPNLEAAGKICTRRGGFIGAKDLFDASFFRISPREAMYMDPQHRVMLEVAWEALEHANLPVDGLYGSDTGVFVGISSMDYSGLVLDGVPETMIEPSFGTGAAHSAASGRISYILGLQGPCLSVDTACSSSLVAVQVACDSLRRGDCTLALVGGVNMMLSPYNHVVFSRAHMLAPDGRCKTFDDAADGYVRSEGAGMIVLKRLSDALADGNRVLAVVRGTAVNQDGPSGGLTVPNGPAQQRVIRRALENAGLRPADVGYVEAHGTGTALGDPIEMNALGEVFQDSHTRARPLFVGSAKTNLGHMEPAAGVGGLIKLVLQLQRGLIAPHLHFEKPSRRIPWDELPIEVPTALVPWPAHGSRRVGGVSSFGFTGTNAHVIVEEAPSVAPPVADHPRPRHLLCLSAKTESALANVQAGYLGVLRGAEAPPLGDVCHSAATGRSHFEHRVAVVCESHEDAAKKLEEVQAGLTPHSIVKGSRAQGALSVGFLFTGQGSQLPGMGRELYETQPAFRAELERCDQVLRESGISLLEALYGETLDAEDLKQTARAQPLIVSLELALAATWRSWGVHPAFVMGHSVGEIAAACVAGVFSLEDALRLAATRGRLMQALPEPGCMVAVQADEATVQEWLEPYCHRVSIAAVNGPSQTVISGGRPEVEQIVSALEAANVPARHLDVSHAFHSPLMEPMLAEFSAAAARVEYRRAEVGFISNLSGRLADEEVASPEYWVRHVMEPVRFSAGIAAMHAEGCRVYLELGPQPTLTHLGARSLPDASLTWLASLDPRRADSEQAFESLGTLYVRGLDIDWEAFDQGAGHGHATLPTYPFEHRPYWFDPFGARARIRRGAPEAHPLLGQLVNLDGAEAEQAVTFESEISAQSPAYLRDHQVFGQAIFPAAGYVELALAATAAALGGERFFVRDMAVQAPLLLDETPSRLRTSLTRTPDGGYGVRVTSLAAGEDGDGDAWEIHAQCVVVPHQELIGGDVKRDIESIEAQLAADLDPAELYRVAARDRGLAYGEAFRGVRSGRIGDGRALGRVALPPGLTGAGARYLLHPALLDAAFHLFGPLVPGQDSAFLPIGIESVEYFRNPGAESTVHVALRPAPGEGSLMSADVELLDPTGAVAVRVSGLTIQRTTEGALRRALDGDASRLLYQLNWKDKPLPEAAPAGTATADSPRSWLLFADGHGVGTELARVLRKAGDRCTFVLAESGPSVREVEEGAYALDPTRAEQFTDLLRKLSEEEALPSTAGGMLYLWSLDVPALGDGIAPPLRESQLLGCGPLLHLFKALATEAGPAAPVFVVTRGAMSTNEGQDLLNVEQSAIAGLLRSVRSELPALVCRQVDLDPVLGRRTIEGEAARLAAEALSAEREEHVAFRTSQRLVVRLDRARRGSSRSTADGGPVEVTLTEYGSHDNLDLAPAQRRDPGPDEVEIAVRAGGINFKDVLHTLGLLKAHAEEHGLPWVDRRKLGFECSGVIARVGENVTGFRVGDAVIGLGSECLSHFVTVHSAAVVPKPARISFAEAAGLPTAYLTAYYGLLTLARLQPGDKVLIHAAAGGVGQAALQVCRQVGAEIFATASRPKWDLLRAQGVRHVMNSRTLDFKDEVLRLTKGRGVDVVLNSLTGDFIPASLDVTSKGGRFVEIGKRGIWPAEQVASSRPDLEYFTFDLGEIDTTVARTLPAMLGEVCQWIAAGEVKALPVQVFPVEQVREAFRVLAQAKNVGKVVVEFPAVATETASSRPRPDARVRPDATYLVTGGMGGLGLEMAQWLVDLGARHLVLMSRRGPGDEAAPHLRRMAEAGARVECVAADVTASPDELKSVLAGVTAPMPPLRGVVHAAGVIDDGPLTEQTWDRFQAVLAPKVAGAWSLHSLTRDQPLDFFICFSSIAATLGSMGQTSYAAGNAFLDALMQHRRAAGLAGLSIGWGPWASVGMAARLDETHRTLLERRGFRPLSVRRSLALLSRTLESGPAHVVAAAVRWRTYLDRLNHAYVPEILESLAAEATAANNGVGPSSEPGALRARLVSAPAAERKGMILAHLQGVLARVLRFASPDQIEPRRGFFDLGLDSLSTVEVKSGMEVALGCTLSVTLLMDCPTPEALVDHLHDKVLGFGAVEATETAVPQLASV
jgi:myxalamid-type polyketide synthase MxaB